MGLKEFQKGGSTMKGNIKKLAVFLIIAAVAMSMPVAMASADDHHYHHCQNAIWGKYASESAASCLLAPFGFNKPDGTPDGTPVNGIGIIYM